MKKTAAEWFIEGLQSNGVTWMATLCGHGLDPLFQAARRAGMRLIDTRNEQTAAYIADAWGRLTGKLGVCAVSSGVAVANALAGVVNAHLDGAPMLLVSGAAETPRLGMGAFQDLDQVGLAGSVTRYSRRVDSPARVMQFFEDAWKEATECRPLPAPVHLMLPMDVQRATISSEQIVQPQPRPDVSVEMGNPFEIATKIAEAKRPLIVAGSGVFHQREGDSLRKFAEAFSIPVVTPIWDRGVFDQASEAFTGIVGAASGGPNPLLEADCIVMAGAAADYRVGYLQPGSVNPQASMCSLTTGWILTRHGYAQKNTPPKKQWLQTVRRKREAFRKRVEERAWKQAKPGGIHAIHIIRAIEQSLPQDAVLLIDGGSIGQWAHQLLCTSRYPSHWLMCGRSGVVGWGIAGAMAARLAYPHRAVVLLSGDGAFTFNVAELECAVRQKLPFVAVVADDQAWGITRTGHQKQFGEAISSTLGPIQFDALAASLGAHGVRASQPEDIARELKLGIERDTVTVVHVPIVGGNPA